MRALADAAPEVPDGPASDPVGPTPASGHELGAASPNDTDFTRVSVVTRTRFTIVQSTLDPGCTPVTLAPLALSSATVETAPAGVVTVHCPLTKSNPACCVSPTAI